MYQPDEIDWRIIALLNQDGRMSSAEISRRLGNVSARTVTNRIDVLIEQGIINIRSVINPEKVGYGVLADVAIQVEPGALRSVTELLAELPPVSYLACATGNTDIFISVRATSINELYDFVIEKVGKLPGVRHTETYLLPINIKTNETWLPPDIFGRDVDEHTENSDKYQGDDDEK
jgi:Lrp/AsnC family transcriptional regulator for asnA, asnC and gidA